MPRRTPPPPVAASCAARAPSCGTPTASATSTASAAWPSPASATATRRWPRAVAHQAATLQHVSNLFGNELDDGVARHARHASSATARRPGGQVFFCNSGAEANECAIKLARKHGGRGRHVVVSALGSFHGRTLATLARHRAAGEARAVPAVARGLPPRRVADLADLERALDPTVAAVLLEPVQGEGGVNPARTEYLQAVRRLCDRAGHPADDRRGADRSRAGPAAGSASSTPASQPDVVTMAKALGNGMPIGACWARADVAAAFEPGDHATTYGGQPLGHGRGQGRAAPTMQAASTPRPGRQAGRAAHGGAGRARPGSPT